MVLIFLFIVGLAIGSFLNVLIDRLPTGKSLFGRSHCDYCRKTLQAVDLIPVISFIALGGRCRRCKKKLSIQYPLIELVTGIILLLVWLYIPISFHPAGWWEFGVIKTAYLGLFTGLIAIFFIDFKHQIIPDELQIGILLLSLPIVFIPEGISIHTAINHLADGIGVMAPILGLYLITKGRGMGFGDVKLAFIMGFLLSLWGGLIALMSAFIFGAVAGLYLILYGGKKMKSKIAFGPFLVLGIVFALLFGSIVVTYFR